ncbi:MAG TPA: 8-oxoguanine deaminase [Actinomycetota bacterium]|nr:8-oxoguanine deaminase [Actinomycetota bacterium]
MSGAVDGRWVLAEAGAIVEAGTGPAPAADRTLDASGCLVLPGLVNCHDHMYQWATRGYAANQGLFGWLTELYPVWARIDATTVRAAARAAMARLLLSGCTLTTDHHYVFPRGQAGIFEALVEAARQLGIRFQPCRGSMSLGQSAGGLPPDGVVEDHDAILVDSERLVAAYHDPAPESMCRVSIAPCSPFSVTPELMRDSAALARRHGLRLHTHLAETVDEEEFCLEKFGKRPVELLEDLGWVGADVWLAHGVHFSAPEIQRLGRSRTGVAHCPSSNLRLGAGACPLTELLAAGARVGLGVDGAASNEDYHLAGEVHQALLLARLRGGAGALDAHSAWRLATAGGAECLGWPEVGALEPGRRADLALFRVDDLRHVGIADPLEALALAPPERAQAVVVEGRVVVEDGRLLTADEDELTRDLRAAAERLRRAA